MKTENHSTACIDRILGGKFFPSTAAIDDKEKDTAKKKVRFEGIEDGDWIPELKRVVQVCDDEGKEHVIGLEKYETISRPTRRRDESAEQQAFKEYAILLKAVVTQEQTLATTVVFRLELQSEPLQEIFRRIAPLYKELRLDMSPIVIEYPFRCLFFLRGQLRDIAHDRDTPPGARRAVSELLAFIHTSFCHKDIIHAYTELVPKAGKVTFPMLYTIFPPYEQVIWIDDADSNVTRAEGYILESVTFVEAEKKKPPAWKFNLLSGDHDGDNFKVRRQEGTVEWFDGTKDISPRNIPVIPLRFFPEQKRKEIRDSIVARGKKYVELCSSESTLLHYKGWATLDSTEGESRLHDWGSNNWIKIDDRVIIDRQAEKTVSGYSENLGTMVASSLTQYLQTSEVKKDVKLPTRAFTTSVSLRDLVHSNGAREDKEKEGGTDDTNYFLNPESFDKSMEEELTDDDYFICRPYTIGFVLGQKTWVYFIKIDNLLEIEWPGDPFQSLQLPEDKKRLVHRLVKGFGSGKADTFDDIIKGKGKGLIFLLHGPPGLGKTLTAESVAESTQRPLYHVTTGELSIDVDKLESQLSAIFRLGARWNAVVLLDEADVLMSRRTIEDLRRNSIVAVFLRLLEYYRGMLFLTTNRRDDFDDAFHNRIHITIQYGELSSSWKTNIWRQHIQRASRKNRKKSLWIEDMYESLGGINLNGRDIKNSTRTAYAFAQAEDEDVSLDEVLIVLKNNMPEKQREQEAANFQKLDEMAAEMRIRAAEEPTEDEDSSDEDDEDSSDGDSSDEDREEGSDSDESGEHSDE